LPPSYQSVTFIQATNELALRLNDPLFIFWTKPEMQLYLAEALRVWNCLTQQWLVDWTTSYTNSGTLPVWNSLANSLNTLVGANTSSPRYQTLTDSYVYTVAQYHLLEPPTGNLTWTGTSQFALADFTNALTRRRDLTLQLTDCNVGPFSSTFSITPGTNRVQLPDTTTQSILDLRRIRFVPDPTLGSPATLYRDDLMSFEYFTHDFEQTFDPPLCWDVLGSPPQFITFDSKPNTPNTLDMLAILSGGVITPPTPSPLLIPDDFSWVLKFGMLADMLTKETESKDLMRAQYCQQRFEEGVQLMQKMPWLTQARINDVPVDTPSFYEADEFDYEWQSNPSAIPEIIRGGIDLFAVSPIIPVGASIAITLSLIGNMPIPASDGAFIQVSREVLNAILDEAEHLAQFKEGGMEFQDSLQLHQRFIKTAMQTNSRLMESGIFPTDIRRTISKSDEAEPRFAMQGEQSK
jgi:hypothetical protein